MIMGKKGRDGEVRSEEEVTEPVESGHDSYATITEQEAIEIALGHVPGEVDDVELEIIDAQVYYNKVPCEQRLVK